MIKFKVFIVKTSLYFRLYDKKMHSYINTALI